MLSFSKTVLKTIIYAAVGVIIILQFFDVCVAQSDEIGIVTANNLNVRSQPGIESRSLGLISKGTKVRILDRHNKWLKILHEGQVGYIRNLNRYVNIISEDNTKKTEKIENTNSDIKDSGKEARNISREIEKGTAELLRFTRKETSIVNSLNDIDLTLDNARKKTVSLKKELADFEKEIKKATNTSEELKKRIKTSEEYASKRLVAIYKLNWLGKIYVLASAQSMYELFFRKKILEQVLAYDENIWENLIDNKEKLEQLLAELKAKKKGRLAVETDLEKEIEMMSRERQKRSQLLDDIRKKRSLKLAALESLKQAAENLDHTVISLKSEADLTEPKENISIKSFSSLKGLLNMPVKGKIVSFFGPHRNKKFNVINFQSGIEIKADRGEPIRAVYNGRILYARWFKGYGNMIIIDHGNNYYTIYAHAQEIFASQGDTVEMGEVVATVGDSGSMIGPSLHFEVRHHGKPVDPLKWINKG
ncbi:MAG: peptidoglycan DD-metalloendopeptidase family protein [Desulfobacterales bacterium]